MINLAALKVLATRGLGAAKLFAIKNAPKLFVGGGIAGGVTATVMACKGTLKANEELDELSEEKEAIMEDESLTDAERKRGLRDVRIRTLKTIGKCYGPSAGVGGASIASILYGVGILDKRFAGAVAVASAGQDLLQNYRGRVRKFVGDTAEEALYRGFEVAGEPNVEWRDLETGNVIDEGTEDEEHPGSFVVTKSNETFCPMSPFSKMFDETNPLWDNTSPEYNVSTLLRIEEAMNRKLDQYGYLFVSDVYQALNFPVTLASAQYGWWLSKDGTTTGRVDLGLYDRQKMIDDQHRAFLNGSDTGIILDIMPDGNLLKRLPVDQNEYEYCSGPSRIRPKE